MKNWIKPFIPMKYIIIAFLIIIVGMFFVETTKKTVNRPYYQIQAEAARIMLQSANSLQKEKTLKNIPTSNELDPNQTGLIGMEFTPLTTTLGNLTAKRTSTNPDFAALMVKFMKEARLTSGDYIAIGASGSFPALIVATLSACKAMEINPLIIYSIGSSEYGANIPDFTIIEMLDILNKENILPYKLLAVSMGGENDQAESMLYPESKELINSIARESGVFFINTNNLEKNIQQRIDLYQEGAGEKPIKLFVNIGGNVANYGTTSSSIAFPNGLVFQYSEIPDHPTRGLIFEFQSKGIPVINLLNIVDLAVKNHLAIDPIPLPFIGKSYLYKEVQYSKWLIILIFISEIFYLYWISFYKKH